MPTDFRYVLGLHEGAVISMADGFALASGEPVLVNLHAAAGSGNAMGGLTNAVHSHSPLVVPAGQQVRSTIGQEVMPANVDAAQLARPLVRWSSELACAQDAPADPQSVHLPARRVRTAGSLAPDQLADLVDALGAATNPRLAAWASACRPPSACSWPAPTAR